MGMHTAILQRLDSNIPDETGAPVFYSRDAFAQTIQGWQNIPVIFAEPQNSTMRHPTLDEQTSGRLPAGMRIVGFVLSATIPPAGQPRLEAALDIYDPEVELICAEGKAGISTQFTCSLAPAETGGKTITGNIKPYHVLLFRQGACPNCWGNDKAALFQNTAPQENKNMTETDTETKNWIKAIHEKLCNNAAKPAAEVPDHAAEIAEMKKQIEVLQNTIAAKDAELAKMHEAEAKRTADAQWETMKNTLPAGWVTAEKEAETRKLFETDKDAFYGNLMKHNATFSNTQAQGSTKSCGCKTEAEQMNNMKQEIYTTCGYMME